MRRGEVMARIRSRGTKLEKGFLRIAREAGLRVRRADHLFGKPDFRIVGTRTLFFVNSCFWHGCPKHCRMPTSRIEYWRPKIRRNVERQGEVVRVLRRRGYRVVVIWEHSLLKASGRVLAQLRRAGT